jgi:hypothetical protein
MTTTPRMKGDVRSCSRHNPTLALRAGQAPVSPPPASICHLTETDVARRWRMSVRTLQAWRWKQVGPPYIKAMGKVLYRLSDIEAFEADHLRGGDR